MTKSEFPFGGVGFFLVVAAFTAGSMVSFDNLAVDDIWRGWVAPLVIFFGMFLCLVSTVLFARRWIRSEADRPDGEDGGKPENGEHGSSSCLGVLGVVLMLVYLILLVGFLTGH